MIEIKKQLKTIYYFLNNTKGNIYNYELGYLYELCGVNKNILENDIFYLNSLLENGNKEYEFVNFFTKLIDKEC